MPTADRPAIVPRAIQYLLRQDYPAKELVILDDGADSVADLIPGDPRIRKLRETRRRTVGAKRNAMVSLPIGAPASKPAHFGVRHGFLHWVADTDGGPFDNRPPGEAVRKRTVLDNLHWPLAAEDSLQVLHLGVPPAEHDDDLLWMDLDLMQNLRASPHTSESPFLLCTSNRVEELTPVNL